MTKQTHALFDPAALSAVERKLVHIRVRSGPDQGSACRVRTPKVFLGTGVGNCIELTDSAVSRRHVALQHTDSGFLVEDLGSTNGTFIEGIQVMDAILAPGKSLCFGQVETEFQIYKWYYVESKEQLLP